MASLSPNYSQILPDSPSSQIYTPFFLSLIRKKRESSMNGVGQTRCPNVEDANRTIIITLYKPQLQMDQGIHHKAFMIKKMGYRSNERILRRGEHEWLRST